MRAFRLGHDRPLDWENFNAWIEMPTGFQGADILRIKGLLNITRQDRPRVIHGDQHIFHPPVLLEARPNDDRRSPLVFITRDPDEKMSARRLKAFDEQGPGPLDPAAD